MFPFFSRGKHVHEPKVCVWKVCILHRMESARHSHHNLSGFNVSFLVKLQAVTSIRVRSRWHSGADVAVCTIEKASTLLNRLLEDWMGPVRFGNLEVRVKRRMMRSEMWVSHFPQLPMLLIQIHLVNETCRKDLSKLWPVEIAACILLLNIDIRYHLPTCTTKSQFKSCFQGGRDSSACA